MKTKSAIIGVRDAAGILHVDQSRVRQYIKARLLPAVRIGREYALLRADVENFEKPTGKRGPKVGSKRNAKT